MVQSAALPLILTDWHRHFAPVDGGVVVFAGQKWCSLRTMTVGPAEHKSVSITHGPSRRRRRSDRLQVNAWSCNLFYYCYTSALNWRLTTCASAGRSSLSARWTDWEATKDPVVVARLECSIKVHLLRLWRRFNVISPCGRMPFGFCDKFWELGNITSHCKRCRVDVASGLDPTKSLWISRYMKYS